MIHAFPGMGADRRMFPAPWSVLPDFCAHSWPPLRRCESIRALAEEVCEVFSIKDGDSLVGASLGGMVACEITQLRDIQTIYLIGSATSKTEINRALSIVHPLAGLVPVQWLQGSASLMKADITQMFAESDPHFIRTLCRAVFEWEGVSMDSMDCHRIHGQYDLIIPLPKNPQLILKGGHLIAMSHAIECVDYIFKDLEEKKAV